MIYLVHRPISRDVVGMNADELNEFLNTPDHQGLSITVEMAFDVDEHECQEGIALPPPEASSNSGVIPLD